MDQYLSGIIVTVLTGIFSVITLLINKDTHKITDKIDEQHNIFDREAEVKAKINEKEKEREMCINNTMMLLLDTNIKILKNEEWAGRFNIGDDVFKQFTQLHERFDLLTEELDDLNKEYAIVIEMTSEFKNEIDRISHEKNDST